MSFVIGKSFGDAVLLLGDTITTNVLGDRTSLTDHVGKLVIVGPSLCVGFAGLNEPAHDAIRSFRSPGRPAWVRHAIHHFKSAHLEAGQQTDFLVAVGDPIYKIFEIKEGQVRMRDTAWVGINAAFSRFQEAWLTNRQSEHELGMTVARIEKVWAKRAEEFKRMRAAMEYAISGDIPGVGGFVTEVVCGWLERVLSHKNGHTQVQTFPSFVYVDQFYTSMKPVTLLNGGREPILTSKGVESLDIPSTP